MKTWRTYAENGRMNGDRAGGLQLPPGPLTAHLERTGEGYAALYQ